MGTVPGPRPQRRVPGAVARQHRALAAGEWRSPPVGPGPRQPCRHPAGFPGVLEAAGVAGQGGVGGGRVAGPGPRAEVRL